MQDANDKKTWVVKVKKVKSTNELDAKKSRIGNKTLTQEFALFLSISLFSLCLFLSICVDGCSRNREPSVSNLPNLFSSCSTLVFCSADYKVLRSALICLRKGFTNSSRKRAEKYTYPQIYKRSNKGKRVKLN